MGSIAQEGNYLGILGSHTVNEISQKGDGIVGMGNKNMKRNMSKIIEELESKGEKRKSEGASDGAKVMRGEVTLDMIV